MKTIKLSLTRSSLDAGLFLFAMLIFTAFTPAARAANYWWNGSTTSTTTNYAWGSTANWDNAASGGSSGAAPTSASDTAIFNKDSLSAGNFTLANNSWIGLNGARAVGGIQFTNGTGGWTIAAHTTAATPEQLSIDAGGVTVGAGVGPVAIQSISGRGTISVALTANQTWNVSSPMTCAAGISGAFNLIKSGTNSLTLSSANTYSGTTTVSAGLLSLGNTNQSSSSVSISSGATLQFGAAGTFTNTGIISVVGSGTGTPNSAGALYFTVSSGPTILNAALTLGGATTISSYGVSVAPTLGGAIGGTGPLTMSPRGGNATVQTAVWTLGAASSYSGNTIMKNNDGLLDATFKLGVANALPVATSLNLLGTVNGATNNFVTLDLNGNPQTLAGLTDTGSSQANASGTIGKRVINSGALATLTINNSGADTYGTTGSQVLAGTIGGTTAGLVAANSLALVKTGAGTLTLSGANTYTGSTTVSNGLINLGVAETPGTSGPLGNPTTLANSIILQGGGLQFSANNTYDYTTSGRLQLADGATGIIDDGGQTVTFANAIGVGAAKTGALTKQGAGTLTLSGTGNIISGQVPSTSLGIETKAGTLNITGGTTTVNTYGLGCYSTDTGNFNQTGGTVSLGGNLIAGWNSGPTFTLSGGSLSAANIYHSGNNDGTLTISGSAIATAGTVYHVSPQTTSDSLTVNLNAGGTLAANRLYVSATYATPPAGSHSLNVNFNGGTLKASATTNLIDVPTGANAAAAAVNVTNKVGGATIDSGIYTATILQPVRHDATLGATLDGGLTKLGSGTVTLSATNTYTGNTTISAGTLALGANGYITNSASIVVASNAVFDVSARSTPFTLAQSLGGQTLSNSAPGAIINGTNNCSTGTISLVYDGVNPAFILTNGGMTLSGSTVIQVNKTGAQLLHSTNRIIAKANGGLVAGSLPGVTVTGGGAALPTSLQLVSGELYLNVNNPPVATNISIGAQAGVLQNLPIIGSGKYAPFDADSDNLTITAVGATTNGGVVAFTSSSVTYSNASIGADSFTYTVSDGFGGTDIKTVTVNVTNVTNQQTPTLTFTGTNVSLVFWGVPTTNYTIQLSTNLSFPWIDLLPTVTATSGQPFGQISFTDTNPPATGMGLYRLKP